MPGANWPNPARFANPLISLAFSTSIWSRPPIEIAIVDLVRGLSGSPRETFRISIWPWGEAGCQGVEIYQGKF